MNNLINTRFYLCGPIDDCPERGRGWRNDLGPYIKEKFKGKILDPLNKKIKGLQRHNEDEVFAKFRKSFWEEEKYEDFAKLMKEVRHIDLRLVDRADCTIVYYDKEKHMCGTLEELFMCNSQKKPVLIVCPQGWKEIPPWLWGAIPYRYFFSSFNDLKTYLEWVNATSYEELNDDRWLFFEDDE